MFHLCYRLLLNISFFFFWSCLGFFSMNVFFKKTVVNLCVWGVCRCVHIECNCPLARDIWSPGAAWRWSFQGLWKSTGRSQQLRCLSRPSVHFYDDYIFSLCCVYTVCAHFSIQDQIWDFRCATQTQFFILLNLSWCKDITYHLLSNQ